jgi:hypothetical protein
VSLSEVLGVESGEVLLGLILISDLLESSDASGSVAVTI